MVLTARGKTLDEAIASLKDRKTAVAMLLKKLQAEQESIEFGETASAPEGQERSEVQRMMQMRSARGGRPPKGLELPKQATVTSNLLVDWPLKYESHDGLLVAVKQLQDQIAAADLAGLKEPKKLSPEEQELEEELAGGEEQQYDPYGNRQQVPVGPVDELLWAFFLRLSFFCLLLFSWRVFWPLSSFSKPSSWWPSSSPFSSQLSSWLLP